eukprot:COSAG02_NODE_1280_length_13477_cov_9.042906_11_plen_185_part_00
MFPSEGREECTQGSRAHQRGVILRADDRPSATATAAAAHGQPGHTYLVCTARAGGTRTAVGTRVPAVPRPRVRGSMTQQSRRAAARRRPWARPRGPVDLLVRSTGVHANLSTEMMQQKREWHGLMIISVQPCGCNQRDREPVGETLSPQERGTGRALSAIRDQSGPLSRKFLLYTVYWCSTDLE